MSAAITISSVPNFVSQEEHVEIVAQTPASFADIPGTLFVIESALAFMSATGRGLQIAYPAIILHALDEGPGDPEASDNDREDMRELSIIPRNTASLEPILEALSRGAALHPDKSTVSDDDDMDNAFLDADSAFESFTGEDDQELSQAGRVRGDFINYNQYAPY
ncbi:hypothetical protein B0H17DRAFT_1163003 [Mycena rosella]|uniref:Uncharacterized protein n=1 Tax=Mycena rosella TaxID=1033263 RepID=A0AAD7CT12_MYCRO|nr:hypothetical protein B0H17DRAFT_1163003 [Mycena rosella]